MRKAAIEERRDNAAENKAMAKLLAEENRIMTLNSYGMDDITKEWLDMSRRDILKRRMLAAARGCFGAGDAFTFSAPGDAFGTRVGRSAGDGFGVGDGIDGGGAE